MSVNYFALFSINLENLHYSRDQLLSLRSTDFKVTRDVRKRLFSLYLWRPKRFRHVLPIQSNVNSERYNKCE